MGPGAACQSSIEKRPDNVPNAVVDGSPPPKRRRLALVGKTRSRITIPEDEEPPTLEREQLEGVEGGVPLPPHTSFITPDNAKDCLANVLISLQDMQNVYPSVDVISESTDDVKIKPNVSYNGLVQLQSRCDRQFASVTQRIKGMVDEVGRIDSDFKELRKNLKRKRLAQETISGISWKESESCRIRREYEDKMAALEAKSAPPGFGLQDRCAELRAHAATIYPSDAKPADPAKPDPA